ncbi:MAG TPA: SDR family oxidoreductase [Planctomycetota bacterium]|nr:SDR family oxidoreductase [Planctomycetota bacterium]
MRLALVTGGAGGIGAAVVRELHAAGHSVVFTHLGQAEEANALLQELEKADGGPVFALESDTASEESVASLHAEHHPDILVHCAGIARDRAIWKQDASDWDAVLGVNLRGAWLQARAAAPHMRASGWGRVILIGSINGTRGKFGQTAYASSKAGLHGLAKSLAKELGPKGVTVNVVEPGWIETPMTAAVPQEHQDAARAETVSGRLGKPSDIASTVVFLASEAASHITGNTLRVDGGQSL